VFDQKSEAEAWAAKRDAELDALRLAGEPRLDLFLARASALGITVERALSIAIDDFLRAHTHPHAKSS